MPKTQIGPYDIVSKAGCDSFGETYEAVDRLHNKKVVLRQLPPESDKEELLSRLQSDRALGALNHPNIARVLGFVRSSEDIYLATEFFKGHSLEAILEKRGKMPALLAASLVRQIMAGVAFAHALGVVHGNLSPSNILLPDYGPVKILNFGLVNLLDAHRHSDPSGGRYLSPEQIAGNQPDIHSDIYSLGMIFYEAIVGKTPSDFYGSSDCQVSKAQNDLIPIPPSLLVAGIPDWLDDFLLHMVAPNPTVRYKSVKQAIQLLDNHCSRPDNVSEGGRAESDHRKVEEGDAISGFSRDRARSDSRVDKTPAHLMAKSKKPSADDRKLDYPPEKELDGFIKTHNQSRAPVSRVRYAPVAVLLLLVASAFVMDTESQSSLSKSVDSMFERMNEEPIEPNPPRRQSQELASSFNNRPERVLLKPQTDVKAARSAARRISPVRPSEESLPVHSNFQKEPAVLRQQQTQDQPKASEPIKITEYQAAKSAPLKVTWEN